MLSLICILGCEREEQDLRPASFPNTAEVFIDGFSAGLEYAAFGDSKVTAFTVDENVSYEDVIGTSSMRFDIPNEGDPEGSYAGGVFRDLGGRDLTGYNALTFYAQASKAATVDLIGFGNDFMGDKYSTTASIKVSTSWNKYIIPIPDPSKLTREKGLFVISEGPEDGDGFSLWVDVVKFENLGTIAHPRPAIFNGNDIAAKTYIGLSSTISGLTQTVNLPNGADQTVNTTPSYFEFISSDTTVAKVDELGVVTVVGQGTAKITAALGGKEVAGSLTMESLGEFEHAPVPDRDAADVISIFSDAYTNVPVDFYNGFFEPFQRTLGGADVEINGDNIIKYSQLNFVATEFKNPTVDATEMTHFHVDIQIENPIGAQDFVKIQLGDFGPDGAFGGGDDATGEVIFKTSPPLASNEWISLDIPFSDFTGLTQRANLAQIFFITDGSVPELPGTITDILVDNMYFYKEGEIPPDPCEAETEQSLSAADFNLTFQTDPGSAIISAGGIYSYINNPDAANTVNPSCKVGQIFRDGNQFANTQIEFDTKFDFTTNSGFKLKVWSPAAGTNVLVKLEDKTNDQINAEVSAVTTATSAWEELTFNFASGESNKHDKIILFFELNSNVVETYYIDDFRLYGDGGGPAAPTDAPAAPPARDAADVVSIYGEAYGTAIGLSNVPWDDPSNFTEENIASNNVLKVEFGSGFLGTDLGSVADASAMTHFHMDFWISDDFAAGQIFNPKWSNHAGGAGETSAFELTRAIGGDEVKKWVSIDVPITDFSTGDNTQRAELAQFLISVASTIDIAYVDNIYFYKEGAGGGPAAPTDAPTPPPARDAADVDSIYGEAYGTAIGLSNVPWDDPSNFTEENIASNNVLKVEFGSGFLGTDLGSVADASAMTHFHMDFWISDDFAAGQIFNPKWSNHAGGAGETSAFELTRAIGGDEVKKWVSIDVPITDFSTGDNTQRAELAQFLISVANTIDIAYVDNIYFYKTDGGSASGPQTAAPIPPARDAANVVSIYSDAYTNITINNFDAGWCGGAAVTEVAVAGNNTLKKNTGIDCHGIDFAANRQDLSSFTHIHFDFYTDDTDLTGDVFNVKLVDFGGGSGEASALEVNINTGTVPAISAGVWVSVDIDITALGGVVGNNLTRSDIAQIGITTANLTNVWYDNIYLYK